MAARLGDGPLVGAYRRRIVTADMFFRSLMSAHNPGRRRVRVRSPYGDIVVDLPAGTAVRVDHGG
ncbi:hypothetical protein AB0M91_17060 [Micromonospora rifamycinica]|uniref:hypothetical protein n=1 Tax=Micromonospora rifamycinica TaxID=291594 RepID=UPI0034367C87